MEARERCKTRVYFCMLNLLEIHQVFVSREKTLFLMEGELKVHLTLYLQDD